MDNTIMQADKGKIGNKLDHIVWTMLESKAQLYNFDVGVEKCFLKIYTTIVSCIMKKLNNTNYRVHFLLN